MFVGSAVLEKVGVCKLRVLGLSQDVDSLCGLRHHVLSWPQRCSDITAVMKPSSRTLFGGKLFPGRFTFKYRIQMESKTYLLILCSVLSH